MDLELESGRIIREATEDDILACIQGEDFAILSATPNTYIQCAQRKEPPYEYVLECQHGSLDEHYRAADGPITLDRVLTTFRKYLLGDMSWRTDIRWERAVPGSPQREFKKLDRALSTPEIDPILRTKVARLKEENLRWRSRMAWAIGVWFIAGIAVGLGTWFCQKPIDRDEIMFSGVCGLGLAMFFIGGMLTRMVFHKPDTKCPQCGHDWKGSDPNDDWLTWRCCPGCGLTMSDDAD